MHSFVGRKRQWPFPDMLSFGDTASTLPSEWRRTVVGMQPHVGIEAVDNIECNMCFERQSIVRDGQPGTEQTALLLELETLAP